MKNWNQLPMMAAAIAMLALSSACTKKRDAALPYGADRELLTISDYENREFDLTTLGLKGRANSGAKVQIVDARKGKSQSAVQNFDYVDYKANDPLKLTDETLMVGRPNYKYQLKYLFEGNLLKVMKLAAPKDLSNDERASAKDAGGGRLMVPVVSYNVSYFSVDTSRNEKNEATSRLELVPQSSRGAASHFKVDMNSKTRASFLSKTMVLPANFFTGDNNDSRDWYYAFTIASVNYKESRGGLGAHISNDKYGREATKIRAKKLEDKIVFYNLAVDDRIEKTLETREENQATVAVVPADFVDFRFTENGKGTSVREESHQENAWDKRAYVELKLKDIKIPGGDFQISEVKDIQLDDGYLSFTVFSEALGGIVRFAFYNTKAYEKKMTAQGAGKYETKIYFAQDEKLFGFFATERESLYSFDRTNQAVNEKKMLVNRFNPTRKVIEYRLNHDAPEWTEDIVKQAAAGWNMAFEKAGVGFRIHCLDQNGKVLRGYPGDLRYSLVNMFHEVDGGGEWGGFGPRLADPYTGEIIMATANMNLTDRMTGMEATLNNYLLAHKGELEAKYILGMPLPSLKTIVDAAQNTVSFVGNALGLSKVKLAVYDPVARTFKKNMKAAQSAKNRRFTFGNQAELEPQFDRINGNIAAQVAAVCPNLKAYAESVRDKKASSDLDLEIKMIKECSVAMAKPIVVSVLLHEMGHNFGLRHNFYGSVDPANFWGRADAKGNRDGKVKLKVGGKEVTTEWLSSTVMDYTPLNHEMMTVPGLYDIAAIRWGYTNQVISRDEKTVLATNPQIPTTAQTTLPMKKFRYCTDEDVDVISKDPMCARSDIGTNPVQIVQSLIDDYNASMATWNNRNGRSRPRSMQDLAFRRIESFLIPMKKYYEQWRIILAAEAGPGNEYLESFEDLEQYQKLVNAAKAKSELNAQYQKASDMIFDFLMNVAFLPDYSCIGVRNFEGGQKALQMFSFSKIQQNIFNSTGTTPKDCGAAEVFTYLKEKKNVEKILAQAGYPFENVYADRGTQQIDFTNYEMIDAPEVVGNALDRFFALYILVERTNLLYSSRANQFMPNFMDEPTYRARLNEKIVNRLTKGVAISETGVQKLIKQEIPDFVSPTFEVEKPLLYEMFGMLKEGLIIPGKPVVSKKRLEKYAMVPMYYLTGNEKYDCIDVEGYNYCATEQHSEALKLVQKLKELDSIKSAFHISDEAKQQFLELAMPLIPEKGKGDQLDITFLENLLEQIEEIKGKDPKLHKALSVMANIFSPEMNIWRMGTAVKAQKIDEADISAKEAQDRVAKLKKIKIRDLAERIGLKLGKDYVLLDQEVLQKRVEDFVSSIRTQAIIYNSDPTELNAQADLILRALLPY